MATALGATLIVTLSACRVDSSVTVHVERDGSGTVTVEAIADADVVKAAPGLAEDVRLDDAVADGWTVEGPTPTEDGGLRVVVSRTFATIDEANVLLSSVSGANGPLQGVRLARVGGVDATGAPDDSAATITLSGALGINGGIDAFADPEVLTAIGASPYAGAIAAAGVAPDDAVTFRLDVDAPGTVRQGGTGAEQRDGLLSWAAPMDGTTVDVTTEYVVSSGSGIWGIVANVALVALVVWCVVAAAFIVMVIRTRARRQAAAQRRRGGPQHPTARRR